MFLTDRQWGYIEPVLRVERKGKRGRKRRDEREVFEALWFILYTGMQWKHLPRTFPPKLTVHDYLKLWAQRDAFRKIFAKIIRSLVQQGQIDTETCFVDATFSAAKGGGEQVGLTRKGKGTKVQLIVDRQGIPLGVSSASADVGETKMVQQTLDFMDEDTPPEHLVGDKAYDADPLDETLAELGIEMVAPHRKNRKPENRTQDGRPLRRYKNRWVVERSIAWLANHRRLLIRWEKHAHLFFALTTLGCSLIAMRHLVWYI
ncbi:MAG: IS5 family transposase [Opitutales bacterium]